MEKDKISAIKKMLVPKYRATFMYIPSWSWVPKVALYRMGKTHMIGVSVPRVFNPDKARAEEKQKARQLRWGMREKGMSEKMGRIYR